MSDASKTVLIVDDEPSQRRLLAELLAPLDLRIDEAASGEEALRRWRDHRPDMILLDVRMPGISGLDVLAEIRQSDQTLPILLITAHADLRQAVEAVKSGADDYLTKPIDLDELKTAILDALGRSSARPQPSAAEYPGPLPDDFICQSPAMHRVVETVAAVAAAQAPLLVLGESGVGKDVVARLIHLWSGRGGQFVAANCAAMPENLIESELFGHVKGAFTGASQSRQGVFRAADGGTLFLDEIGDLPLHLQPKLLRALESGAVTPVGGDTSQSVDTRLVAATNRDLGQAVTEGRFREDLYYRINVIEIEIPPLRERREDILPLARRFAAEFASRKVRLSQHAVDRLLVYRWPGNVRQLRNAIQRACLMCRGDIILPEHLPADVAASIEQAGADEATDDAPGRLSQVERATILAVLEECGGNKTQAAKRLGISRRTLIYKLRAMGQ